MHMERLTTGGFNALSDKEGFVVVYPDGIERHWNDGREKVRYRTHREKIDDVGFLSALIDQQVRDLNLDKQRVYATGMSNGALMSFRLASELSDKIAAIAPVACNMPKVLEKRAPPAQPIPVLLIANTEDPCVPWEGGELRFALMRLGLVLSVMDTVHYWVAHNQCEPKPTVTWLPDTAPQDGTRVRREVYGKGRDGTEVILYAIVGGGHTWPGGYQYLPVRFVGKTCRDINACEVIWDFFKSHPRKQ